MQWKRGWRRLTRVWRSETARNVDEELHFHFEQKVAEFEAQGMSAAQSRVRAEEEFGDVGSVRASLAEIDSRVAKKNRRAEWWEAVLQDLKYVARGLRRSPMFTVTVVVTLALGLGANASIFSLLDRLYLQAPEGVASAGEVKRTYHRMMNRGEWYTSDVFDRVTVDRFKAVAPAGLDLTAFATEKVRLGTSVDDPMVTANFVEGNFFGILGLRPALGRVLTLEEMDVRRTELVAVISEQLWRTQFLSDPAVIGKLIDLGSHRHQIVGVVANNFRGLDLDAADVWVPRSTKGIFKGRPTDWYAQESGTGDTRVIMRPANAKVALEFETRSTAMIRNGKPSESTIFLGSIIQARGGQSRTSELAISTRFAGVAVVILLIACANVVNLLLARASVRRREIALRIALGVSRKRLVLQLVIESLTLAFISGVAALAIATVATTLLQKLLLPDVTWGRGVMGVRVILFTSAAALVTGVVAGLIPALQSSKPNLSGALKSSTRDGGVRQSSLRSGLLVVQAALSVVLLAGAGVFVSSMRSVENIDVGYDVNRLLFASVGYNRELENRSKEISARLPDIAESLKRIPGVESVGMSDNIPMYGFGMSSLFLPDRDSVPRDPVNFPFRTIVSPTFFSTVGMRMLHGRGISEADGVGAEPVIVINQALANLFWPGEDPLTKCIIYGARTNPCRRVIGIVSHGHYDAFVEKGTALQYYIPLAQSGQGPFQIAIRVREGATVATAATVRRELANAFGPWSRPSVRIMSELVEPDLRPWRVGAQLFSAAGLLALLVAAVGVYSSMAYTISQRTQEMGVRVALGAVTSDIVGLVLKDGVRVVALGVTIGIAFALALGSLVASMLYDTSPRDPFVLGASAAILIAVAAVACSVPALRAARVDPLTALRAE